MVRAKFKVTEITDPEWGEQYPGVKQITLSPVIEGSEENRRFYAATPGGSISLGVVNAAAAAAFAVGKAYYVDFSEAPA